MSVARFGRQRCDEDVGNVGIPFRTAKAPEESLTFQPSDSVQCVATSETSSIHAITSFAQNHNERMEQS